MKNQFKFLFFMLIISGVISLMSCNSNASDADESAATNTDLAEDAEPIAGTTGSWEEFWQTFQAAAATKDKEKIAQLCIWGDAFPKESFNENYEMFFSKEMLDLIAKTAAKDILIDADVPVEVEEPREIALHESSIEEGEEYESAFFLYFGKVNGRYALVQFMAAG